VFVIAVSNHTHGAGKTTTALALAACLSRRGQRVLAIDLDPKGTLGAGAGVPAGNTATTSDLLRGTFQAQDAAPALEDLGLETLKLIPADSRLAQTEGWLSGKVGYDEILRERLASAHDAFDCVVLDCPPSLRSLTLNAIVAADVVLAVAKCDFVSARSTASLQEMVGVVRELRRPELAFHVIPTHHDPQDRVCRQVLKRLRKDFASSVSNVAIGVDPRASEAHAKGLPLSIYTPDSRASLAYEALTLEIQMIAARQSLAQVAA
jgi:chromosome partitioning protein